MRSGHNRSELTGHFQLLQIDHGHEVSWLSELRQVSVLFINLDPGQQTDAAGTLKLLQSSFDVIYPSLSKYDGKV